MGLFEDQYYQRCILVTDDNHADTLKNLGHIDKIIRMAINLGAAPIKAIKMASYNPALNYKLYNYGAIANGYIYNFIILNDLNKFEIDSVYFNGNIVGHDSHNIIAVGVNDEDLVIAVNALKENKDRIVEVIMEKF